MTVDLRTSLGPVDLSSPLVAASGTVGSVWELARVADLSVYGALTAKSVSGEAWPGSPPPRIAPAGLGMLNGIGIQNPGIEEWVSDMAPRLGRLQARVWGSAVGRSVEEFARVAQGLDRVGVTAIELNLSCPNLGDERLFAVDPSLCRSVVAAVREVTSVPLGAKLSPNASDIVAVAAACSEAGADWVTLTNTVWGARIDSETRRPVLSSGVGGYSGPPLKPIALRCVMEVTAALPGLAVLGCGGVIRGEDVVEFLLAGASAVGVGTIHFAEPRAGRRITDELITWCEDHGVSSVTELVGGVSRW